MHGEFLGLTTQSRSWEQPGAEGGHDDWPAPAVGVSQVFEIRNPKRTPCQGWSIGLYVFFVVPGTPADLQTVDSLGAQL